LQLAKQRKEHGDFSKFPCLSMALLRMMVSVSGSFVAINFAKEALLQRLLFIVCPKSNYITHGLFLSRLASFHFIEPCTRCDATSPRAIGICNLHASGGSQNVSDRSVLIESKNLHNKHLLDQSGDTNNAARTVHIAGFDECYRIRDPS
jgi:hypothetical protein